MLDAFHRKRKMMGNLLLSFALVGVAGILSGLTWTLLRTRNTLRRWAGVLFSRDSSPAPRL